MSTHRPRPSSSLRVLERALTDEQRRLLRSERRAIKYGLTTPVGFHVRPPMKPWQVFLRDEKRAREEQYRARVLKPDTPIVQVMKLRSSSRVRTFR